MQIATVIPPLPVCKRRHLSSQVLYSGVLIVSWNVSEQRIWVGDHGMNILQDLVNGLGPEQTGIHLCGFSLPAILGYCMGICGV